MKNRPALTLVIACAIAGGVSQLRGDDSAQGARKETATKSVEAGKLTLEVPESWKQKPGIREPRVAEFQIPAREGD